jgi:hypothetical protein|nr:MAG TPA: hypothetical protein [Caudoviricetes sp.]
MSNKAQDNKEHLYEVEVIQTRVVRYFVKAKNNDEAAEKVLTEDFFDTDESLSIEIVEEINDSVESVMYICESS